ncbi:GntR family transcriptional regulator [Microbaculum marinum]|uniref:GntR family transcriptional regulator n=1 Tax=Microbaculum marinum TaxID=1764581 RepID=A0AAW9RNU6_9HYPH
MPRQQELDEVAEAGRAPSERISIQSAALADKVYDLILEQLISLRIPPGARITVDELVRQYGVSQTPIREALSRLESHGLVTKTHRIGYRTAPQFTREQLHDLYEIRMLLEPAAARKAAVNIDPGELDELADLIAEMQRETTLLSQPKYGRFARHDGAFHACIASASKNDLIADAVSRLHSQVHMFRHFYNTSVTDAALLEHQAIAAAIAARDAGKAEECMRAHIEESWRRLEKGF